MTRTRHKYELIDNASGRTLVSGSSPAEALSKAGQYILDYNVSPNEVAYVVIKNGKRATVVFTCSGDELRELIEDEAADDYYDEEDDLDEW